MNVQVHSKFYHKVQKQFILRSKRFEKSAAWMKDKGLIQLHKNLLSGSKYRRILEVCCGTGIMGRAICKDSAKIVGLDVSLDMLRKARNRLDLRINGLAEVMPFKDDFFDVVLCRQALHFLDLERAFKELKRVCCKGGIIIISQIVPFGRKDEKWLLKIHQNKQPLLKNFLKKVDIIAHLKKLGLRKIEKQECIVRESIEHWLSFAPELDKNKIEKVKKLYREAPPEYKSLHKVRIFSDDIFEDMCWVLIKAEK
jgi:DNA gyrase subunit B